LGPRNDTKKIYQPSWDNGGPHIRYTPNKDGAFAELGPNAMSSWKMAVYQLAHETMHLLDQHGGEQAITLEEGVAVRFSLDMLEKYGFDTTGLPSLKTYKSALALFNQLGSEPYSIVKKCRLSSGSFNSIDKAVLSEKCAIIDQMTIAELLESPVMR